MKIADFQPHLTLARLDTVAALWGGRGESVRFIRAVENFVYEFEANGRPLILRFTHSSHRTTDQVTAELELVDFLARNLVPVARAVASRAGNLIENLPVEAGYFSVAVFEKAPGTKSTFDLPPATQDALFHDWGSMVGAMHRVVPRYREGSGDPRRHVGIEDDNIRHAANYLPAQHQQLVPVLAGLLAEIRKFPKGPPHYGLLHTDCHHGNFHVERRQLTLFDFDDCCHHWFSYDVTIPLWHFPLKDRGQNPERDRATLTHFFQQFLRGYQTQNAFPREWLDQVKQFIRLRDLQLFIFSWKSWDPAQPDAWQPKFWQERGVLIESGRPSIDLNWAELTP